MFNVSAMYPQSAGKKEHRFSLFLIDSYVVTFYHLASSRLTSVQSVRADADRPTLECVSLSNLWVGFPLASRGALATGEKASGFNWLDLQPIRAAKPVTCQRQPSWLSMKMLGPAPHGANVFYSGGIRENQEYRWGDSQRLSDHRLVESLIQSKEAKVRHVTHLSARSHGRGLKL